MKLLFDVNDIHVVGQVLNCSSLEEKKVAVLRFLRNMKDLDVIRLNKENRMQDRQRGTLAAGRCVVSCSRTYHSTGYIFTDLGMRKPQALTYGRGFNLLHHPAAQSTVSIHICKLLKGLAVHKAGRRCSRMFRILQVFT